MGVNITIENEDGNIPEWDYIRHAGDSEVYGCLYSSDVEYHPDNDAEFTMVRPVDVDAFEQRLYSKINCNQERWEQMARLLRDKNNWLCFSY